MKSPFLSGEGPYGLVICPSRELAVQTFGTVEYFAKALKTDGFPQLRSVCMIGGTSVQEQVNVCIVISVCPLVNGFLGRHACACMYSLYMYMRVHSSRSLDAQSQVVRHGIHIAIATPGRLNDMLIKKRMTLTQCMFLTLDEADR